MMSGSVKMIGGGGKNSSCNLSDSGSTKSTRKFRFLSWSSETYTLQEFVNSFPLPRVVRVTNCEDSHLIKSLQLPADVDVTQPLLLYKKYRAVKVQAKCLKLSKSGKWKDVGVNSIIIPDSFPGWFSLLTNDGKECAMMLTSMAQVAAARVPAFLTKFDVPVYKLTDSNELSGNKSVYVRTTMKAGSVLRLLGVWADFSGGSRNFNSFSHQNFSKGATQFLGGSLGGFGGRLVARSLSHAPPPQQQPPQVQYVQCLNHENEPIFIPFWATGVFYPIAPRGGRNPQHIYPLNAIARSCPGKGPLRAKMVFGNLPNNLPEFNGALQIDNVDTEDVILACTLLKDKPSLFEIDIESELLLSQMTSEDLFIKSTGYQSALTFCRSESENWKRQIRECGGGSKTGGGTVSSCASSYLLKKSLRIRSSPPPPSKLSLLFRPSSAIPRRSKSFNVEVQSVSLCLNQDEEDEDKKLSTLFNFMNGKGNHGRRKEKQLAQNHIHHHPSVPDVLSNYKHHHNSCSSSSSSSSNKNSNNNNFHHRPHPSNNSNNNHNNNNNNNKSSTDLYGRVLDDVTEEENIYSEISDALTMKLSLNPKSAIWRLDDDMLCIKRNYHGENIHRLPRQSASNMSSLLKGGSDGAFSGTLSGTFSSSNPSNREEDIYDSVF